MADQIPDKMRAVVLSEYRADVAQAIAGLTVSERPVPSPRRGQVLVKVAAAPCNPSDLLLLQGKYGVLKKLPTVPGWEGAGAVVASGGGFLARWLRGKRVACALRKDRDGTWAEYFLADANNCIPLKSGVPIDQGAGLIVNPLTAMGLLDTSRRDGHQAAIHTAGASQLGRMMIAMAAELKYPLINIARRRSQVEMLKSLGAEHVLNSSDRGFQGELQSISKKLRATAVFEAVAGDMSGTVLNAMPHSSVAYVYGALSEQPCGNIDPVGLLFFKKSIRGFYLAGWMEQIGVFGALRAASRVQRMIIDGRIAAVIQRRVGLDEVVDGLNQYVKNMTGGKVLIMPQGVKDAKVK